MPVSFAHTLPMSLARSHFLPGCVSLLLVLIDTQRIMQKCWELRCFSWSFYFFVCVALIANRNRCCSHFVFAILMTQCCIALSLPCFGSVLKCAQVRNVLYDVFMWFGFYIASSRLVLFLLRFVFIKFFHNIHTHTHLHTHTPTHIQLNLICLSACFRRFHSICRFNKRNLSNSNARKCLSQPFATVAAPIKHRPAPPRPVHQFFSLCRGLYTFCNSLSHWLYVS